MQSVVIERVSSEISNVHMDEVATMTVPPPLPAKLQARGASQGARQTVSIRAVSPPSSPPLGTVAAATVFVGANTHAADSTATCGRRIPEVQSTRGFDRQNSGQSQQLQVYQQQCVRPHQLQQQQHQRHQHHQQQQQQQAAHVVKIKINPDGAESGGRVISTVRLTLNGNGERGIENGIARERSNKRDGAVVVSASNLVNGERCGSVGAGESRVRISVVGGDASEQRERNNNDSGGKGSNGRGEDDANEKDMVHRATTETINGSVLAGKRSSGCFYYNNFQSPLAGMVMSSGQCSPSDTLDSGTCSDLDGTPPPLPKKKNAKSTVILGHVAGQHNRTGSLTSSGAEVDSDDNESNISCDSLNGRDLAARIEINGTATSEREQTVVGRQARSRNGDTDARELGVESTDESSQINGTVTKLELIALTNGRSVEEDRKSDDRHVPGIAGATEEARLCGPSASVASGVTPSPTKASSTPPVRSPEPSIEPNGRISSPVVKECTYEERKLEQERLEQETAAADRYANYNKSGDRKYLYEDDRFYKFHVNELQRAGKESSQEEDILGSNDIDECFAGCKILEKEAIRSAKGTVRGVKNRVRAGIATFLQKPSTKDYKAKEEGKVVLYMTSSGIVRETYYNCLKLLRILRTHMVKYEKRNLFYNEELQAELRERMSCEEITLPQLFIDGQWLGDADTVERLNESGELRFMLNKYKSCDAARECDHCGGAQWVLCKACNGSKKSNFRNEFTTEYFFLKCMQCDEAGLVPCPYC